MLLMVEKGIRGRICHEMYRYAKANNIYIYERIQQRQRIIISYVFRCKQFIWMGNVLKLTSSFKWKKILSNLIKTL